MKIAYFDCIAGASGDMILGALIDAGADEAALRQKLHSLGIEGFGMQVRRVTKHGIAATRVEIHVLDQTSERRLPEIEAIIQHSALPAALKKRALTIFRRLGEAEARLHNLTPEEVHLHELGGVDTIVDVVGVLTGLDLLGIKRIHASPLPLGRGFVHSAHGNLPLPAPATLALLSGAPLVGSEIQAELVTPTAAALLSSLVQSWGAIPSMRLTSVGYGAGERDLPIPNLLRVLIGETTFPGGATIETINILETHIDDQNPQFYEHVMARLFAAGALDVTLSSIQMKKNRPGTLLRVLCAPDKAEIMTNILFSETPSLGVRLQAVERRTLERQIKRVETPYGTVRVKIASYAPGAYKLAPEYEDCRKLAEDRDIPIRDVYRAAEMAAWKLIQGEAE